MKLSDLIKETQEVSPFLFVTKNGNLFKVYRSNNNGGDRDDAIQVQSVTRMWTLRGQPRCAVDPVVATVKLSDGYEVLSASEAYDMYQLQHGFAKRLAAGASESPNYIRQINNIDS